MSDEYSVRKRCRSSDALAIRIIGDAALVQYPENVAARRKHAILANERVARIDALFDGPEHALQVVGMHPLDPGQLLASLAIGARNHRLECRADVGLG
jgi:hypothetical protein